MSLTPFYRNYPKDPEENLRWRLKCGERALEDLRFRHALYDACMEDVLFFMAFACWAYEPRAKHKILPFVPWVHQCEVFVRMDAAIDESAREEKAVDVLLDKSRAQGGTYGYLWILLRRWLRDPMFSVGYVTRNEALVDSPTDADTLFWKLAWGISKLPVWMLPKGFDMKKHRSLSSHTILNPENGATHSGYAAGQDVAAGGRKTVFAVDEFGSRDFVSGGKDESVMEALHDVSSCIFLVSARYVDSGVFHNACEDKQSGGIHLILDWKDHPTQARNSYVVKDNVPVARVPGEQESVDEYHQKHRDLRKRLEGKGFKWEGVVRSPWYDMRCLRPTATPRLIASQLDRDPRGAVGKVFQGELLDRMKKECCRAPVWQGVPVFDGETLSLIGLLKKDDGPLKLWFKPGPDFSCPLGPFTLGCDVAIGSDGAYSSNSVVSGIDDRTGEQVLEYTVNGVPMIKFGRTVVGLAKWLHQALVGWEDSGMVAPFAKEIMEVLYYPNIYYRTVEAIGVKKKTKKPGWWNGKDEHKADLFEKLALGMETGKCIVRSDEAIRECAEYEWSDGKIIHQPTKNRGAREKAHGDRVISLGVVWLVLSEGFSQNALDTGDEKDQTPQYGSFLWREQRERTRVDSDSPEFGIRDVIAY